MFTSTPLNNFITIFINTMRFSAQPSEAATSYFPTGAVERRTSSAGSSMVESTTDSTADSTATSTISETARPWNPGPASERPTGDYPLPAIETPFPAPAGELDVAAQLAKDPLPRSLHSSLRRAAESAASSSRRREDADPEARARALAAAKKEWLSWKSI